MVVTAYEGDFGGMTDSQAEQIALTPFGGPTVLIEIAGTRFLTDPTFDPAGPHANGPRTLTKTSDALFTPADAGRVDAVLLSHDQHADNLDDLGREFLKTVPLVITTTSAASRIDATVVGLEPWKAHKLGLVTITAVPAQHGPNGTEQVLGPVIGFVLQAAGAPTVYVSGDNASIEVVRTVVERSPRIDVAVIFAGAGRTSAADGTLTLTGQETAVVTEMLQRPRVLVAHTDEWAHLTEDYTAVMDAFQHAGLSGVLIEHTPGRRSLV